MPEVKYNSDELVPPAFINAQFVEDFIKSVEKDPELKLISHAIKPGSAAGDHYASIMFKIIATYETKGRTVTERRFILKTMPVTGQKADMLGDEPIFAVEIKMYTQTLAEMEKILNAFGESSWWPTLVYSAQKPDVIIFDDLTQEHFEMVYDPLRMDQIEIVVEKIARYHALSMVIAESDQKAVIPDGTGPFFEPEMLRAMFDGFVRIAKDLAIEAKNWPDMQVIGAKLEGSIERVFTNFAKIYAKAPPGTFNVLNHGDFHLRNLMFTKDDEGSITDVKFLDFQVPLYRSAGFDLVYMLNAMAATDVRARKPEFLRMYHGHLVASLEKYGFSGRIPTLFDVNVEVLHMAPFDAFHMLSFLPIFQKDLAGIELSQLFSKDEENEMAVGLRKLHKKPEFVEEMSRLMIAMDNMGLYE